MVSPSADQLPYFGPLLDHTEDAIVACDADWRVTVWNQGARRMYGWTVEEAIGRPETFFRLDESDEQRMDRRWQLAEYGRWRGEIMVQRKDGSKVPVEAISVAIRDEQGGMSGYLGIHRDITERNRAEEALRAANRRTEAILERISDTFFAVDDQWRYTYVNERAVGRAREAWGRDVSAEELLGRNCWELFPELLGTAFDRELHRAVREQQVVEFETYSAPTDTWVEVRAYPSRDGLSVYSRDVTARKRGRQALAYHASLLDNVEDGVIVTDADDFRITAWNKGAERVYGFTAEEVLGRPAREVASYPGDEARPKLEHELLETGRTRIEFTARRKDGTPTEVELIAAEVRDDRRVLTGYLGIHRDINERKRTEEALREANRRIESILQSISDSFFAVDRDWRYTYLNERAVDRISGALGRAVTAEQLLGQSCWETFPEWAETPVIQAYERALLEQKASEVDVYVERSASWFEAHLYPSANGVSTYLRDITERKQAEEKVAYHAQLLENMEDAVLATDETFVLTAWNRGAERMFGWTADEAIGQRLYDLLPSSFSDEELAAELARLLEAGRWRGEATWYTKDGKPVFAEANNVALRSEAGSVTGYQGIMRDLSERQRARKELEMHARQQALLAELTLRNLANGELQALLDDAVALAADTLEVELSSIAEILPGGREMSWRAASGWDQETIANAAPSSATSGSLVGYAFTTGRPVISEDVRNDHRFQISELFAQQRPVSAVAVVIPVENEGFGALVAASRAHRSFTSEDVDFMRAVANIIGVAVEQSRVVERLEEVRESERSRIARDLHDDALSELAGAVGQASVAASAPAFQGDQERWRSQLAMLQRIGQQLRSSIYDLRLSGEEHRPFVDLLSELVAHHSEMTEGCDVRLQGQGVLPARPLGRHGTEILRNVGEAVTNARGHSGARNIIVDASGSDAAVLRLKVSDDGTWQPPTAPDVPGHGTGITGMKERADLLGARLNIDSRPGGGTVVALELKLANSRQQGP